MSSSPPPPRSSCWASVTSALRRGPRTREPSLQEQLLAASERANVERLRERAGALQRELDAVAVLASDADAALRAAAREREAHEGKLRAVDEEIRAMDQRIRVLQAIVATITPK
uniref:Uncharacterized protein n=1 Tax=Oryza punctata TaxID=4537 RepID=A0A0E0JFP2_ORYPU